MKADPGIALVPVPVAPITVHLAQERGYVLCGRFDLLKTHDVRPLRDDPVVNLLLARADAVDVPGRDLQHAPLTSCSAGCAATRACSRGARSSLNGTSSARSARPNRGAPRLD